MSLAGSGPGERIHLCGDIIPSPPAAGCNLHGLVHLHSNLSCQGGERPHYDGGGAGLSDGGGGARALLPGVCCLGLGAGLAAACGAAALGPLGLGWGVGSGGGRAAGACTSAGDPRGLNLPRRVGCICLTFSLILPLMGKTMLSISRGVHGVSVFLIFFSIHRYYFLGQC